jgi:hypothetical protein
MPGRWKLLNLSFGPLRRTPNNWSKAVGPPARSGARRSPSAASSSATRWASCPMPRTPPGLLPGTRQAARPPRKLDMQGVGWRVVLTTLDWKWSPPADRGYPEARVPTSPSATCPTKPSTKPSTRSLEVSFDASWSPACAAATARARRAPEAMIAVARSRTWFSIHVGGAAEILDWFMPQFQGSHSIQGDCASQGRS